MKGGKVESGTAQRKLGGSNPREAAEDKAPQTPGNMRSLKESGQVSADNRVLDALVKEKENHVDNEWQRKRKKRSRPVRHA